MEDRLPTETFPPDFEELLFPFETEDLELPLLAVPDDLVVDPGFEAELRELELGLDAALLDVVVGLLLLFTVLELLPEVETRWLD